MTKKLGYSVVESLKNGEASHGTAAGPHFAPPSESPSLRGSATCDLPAFEVKFLLSESSANELERHLAERLTLDPHADPSLGHAYRITTLYADTPQFEVYHRLGWHKHSKFRLRRYGNELLTYVERKTKRGQRVRKKRVIVDPHQFSRITDRESLTDFPAEWYRHQFARHALRLVCRVSYTRKAYFGSCDEGPLRVTFDRELRAAAVEHLAFDQNADETSIGDGRVVCEFKFRGHLPALFKSALETFQIVPGGFSKYRTSVRALGLAVSGADKKGGNLCLNG